MKEEGFWWQSGPFSVCLCPLYTLHQLFRDTTTANSVGTGQNKSQTTRFSTFEAPKSGGILCHSYFEERATSILKRLIQRSYDTIDILLFSIFIHPQMRHEWLPSGHS